MAHELFDRILRSPPASFSYDETGLKRLRLQFARCNISITLHLSDSEKKEKKPLSFLNMRSEASAFFLMELFNHEPFHFLCE